MAAWVTELAASAREKTDDSAKAWPKRYIMLPSQELPQSSGCGGKGECGVEWEGGGVGGGETVPDGGGGAGRSEAGDEEAVCAGVGRECVSARAALVGGIWEWARRGGWGGVADGEGGGGAC